MQTLRGYTVALFHEQKPDDIVTALLQTRKVDTSETSLQTFFNPKFSHLYDPFLMPGMDKAVERIIAAKEAGERIVVFGDYDVDGVSSTAMLVRFFADLGMQVSYRLPHRVKDGYGLKPYFIDELKEKDVKLIITVDCGTRDIEAVKHAKENGIDVIVTDHHAVPEVVPQEVIAILNPKTPGSSYPFSSLSGSGVAFKLLCWVVLTMYGKERYEANVMRYIDFATLGTIADCMPLVDENRVIATLGLLQLKKTTSHGLRKLIEGRIGKLDADIVGFHIGPRINAAGRMDTPYTALKMLLAGEQNLDPILEEIEDLNTKRRASTDHFVRKAFDVVNQNKNIIIYDSTEIEHGIIGLIAGRLTEAFNKPAIALKDEGDKLVGSCRSPEYLDIVALLETVKQYFIAWGGHKQAAGFSIYKKDFEDFKKAIEKNASSLVEKVDNSKRLLVDMPLDITDIDGFLLEKINKLKPFGIGNRKPLFILRNFLYTSVEYLGKEMRHLRFKHSSGAITINAFGFWEFYDEIRKKKDVSLVFEIEKNVWMGKETLCLNVKDIIL